MKNYKHLVEVDAKNRRLVIQRVFSNGEQEFFTETRLPDVTLGDDMEHI